MNKVHSSPCRLHSIRCDRQTSELLEKATQITHRKQFRQYFPTHCSRVSTWGNQLFHLSAQTIAVADSISYSSMKHTTAQTMVFLRSLSSATIVTAPAFDGCICR